MLNSIVNWQIVYTNILGYVVREGRKAISDKIVKRIIELNNKAISDYEEARKKRTKEKRSSSFCGS